MNLAEYPTAIANCQRRQLAQSQHIRRLEESLTQQQSGIEKYIAEHAFSNDQSRKAKRLELMQEPDYLAAVNELQAALDKKTDLEIELTLLKNQFAVRKLQMQQAIASQSEEAISYVA